MNTDRHRFFLALLIASFCLFNSACLFFTSIPPNVKTFLESADKIELITEADKKDGKLVFQGDMMSNPNLQATITDEPTKNKILNALYNDAVGGGEASCFLPRHILRAIKGNQIVEIEICYQCSRYIGKGSLGEFKGGLNFSTSDTVFNQILFEKGVEIK